jgi:hypothetical protein
MESNTEAELRTVLKLHALLIEPPASTFSPTPRSDPGAALIVGIPPALDALLDCEGERAR